MSQFRISSERKRFLVQNLSLDIKSPTKSLFNSTLKNPVDYFPSSDFFIRTSTSFEIEDSDFPAIRFDL